MKFAPALGLLAGVALLGVTGLAAHHAESDDGRGLLVDEVVPVVEVPASSPAVVAPELARQVRGRTGQPRKTTLGSGAATAVDPRWARRTAVSSGIPLPALTAYARASVLAPRGCRIGWTTLAGVGWIESQHGTIGDRLLRRDGQSSDPILGPALDGSGEFANLLAGTGTGTGTMPSVRCSSSR